MVPGLVKLKKLENYTVKPLINGQTVMLFLFKLHLTWLKIYKNKCYFQAMPCVPGNAGVVMSCLVSGDVSSLRQPC